MRFFLMGFMGCGKSSIGKKLATNLNMDFVDLDQMIEQHNNARISDLFAKGEDYFRKLESVALRQVIDDHKSCLIALGGGTPCYKENMQIISENGFSIYIRMTAEALCSRLKHNRESRPLIRDLKDDELLTFIRSKLEQREVYYKQAQLSADGLSLKGDRLKFLADELRQISST